MNTSDKRQAIRALLNEREAADALASYYAFYHPDPRTHLTLHKNEAGRATGYIAISGTGIDLFRPLVTMRLPADMDAGYELLARALPGGSAAIFYAPMRYSPLLHALFDLETTEEHHLLILEQNRFEPVINVLVTTATAPDGLPRFVIRSQQDPGQVVAAAGVNWQTPYFAEISVHTVADERRQGWGRSVAAAMVQHLLQSGRTPLYVSGQSNHASLNLAQGLGFRDSGHRVIFSPATRKESS
jgi:hypothetical protein